MSLGCITATSFALSPSCRLKFQIKGTAGRSTVHRSDSIAKNHCPGKNGGPQDAEARILGSSSGGLKYGIAELEWWPSDASTFF